MFTIHHSQGVLLQILCSAPEWIRGDESENRTIREENALVQARDDSGLDLGGRKVVKRSGSICNILRR